MGTAVLLIHVAATLFMVGVNWFLQLVHHPLYPRVGLAEFVAYETAYNRAIGPVIFLPTIVALLTAALLLWRRPAGVPLWLVLAGLSLLAVNLVSTVVFQAPQHQILAQGFDEAAYRTLLTTQWIRTAAWTVAGAAVLAMVARALAE